MLGSMGYRGYCLLVETITQLSSIKGRKLWFIYYDAVILLNSQSGKFRSDTKTI